MTEAYDDFPDYVPNMGAWGESKPGNTPGERQGDRHGGAVMNKNGRGRGWVGGERAERRGAKREGGREGSAEDVVVVSGRCPVERWFDVCLTGGGVSRIHSSPTFLESELETTNAVHQECSVIVRVKCNVAFLTNQPYILTKIRYVDFEMCPCRFRGIPGGLAGSGRLLERRGGGGGLSRHPGRRPACLRGDEAVHRQ